MIPCRACGTVLPADSDPRKIYCDATCRSRSRRFRERWKLERAQELVLLQTRAVIAGDHEALRAIEAEARALLPAR